MATFHYPWSGNENALIEDLVCRSDNGPDVTFWTPEGYSEIDDGPFPHLPMDTDFLCGPNSQDDWIDVYVAKITAVNVKKALAFINRCQPEDIDLSNDNGGKISYDYYPWKPELEKRGCFELNCRNKTGKNASFWSPGACSAEKDFGLDKLTKEDAFIYIPCPQDDWVDVFAWKVDEETVRKALAAINRCEPKDIILSA